MAELESRRLTACCGGEDSRNSRAFGIANSSVVEEEANSRCLLDQLYSAVGAVNAAVAEPAASRTAPSV